MTVTITAEDEKRVRRYLRAARDLRTWLDNNAVTNEYVRSEWYRQRQRYERISAATTAKLVRKYGLTAAEEMLAECGVSVMNRILL